MVLVPEVKVSPNVPRRTSSCMTPSTFPFHPSPFESVIVMVRKVEVRLGHPPSGQKVAKTVEAVKVLGVLVAILLPFSVLIVNPTSLVLVPRVETMIWVW